LRAIGGKEGGYYKAQKESPKSPSFKKKKTLKREEQKRTKETEKTGDENKPSTKELKHG